MQHSPRHSTVNVGRIRPVLIRPDRRQKFLYDYPATYHLVSNCIKCTLAAYCATSDLPALVRDISNSPAGPQGRFLVQRSSSLAKVNRPIIWFSDRLILEACVLIHVYLFNVLISASASANQLPTLEPENTSFKAALTATCKCCLFFLYYGLDYCICTLYTVK